jgi:integrase
MEKKNFTKQVLEAIKPQAGRRVVVHDTKVEGLILRVQPTGKKSFCWLRKGAGQVRFKRIGAFPDLSVENARGKASEYNSSLARWAGDDFQGESPFERRPNLTLGEVFDHYVDHYLAKHAKNPPKATKGARWQFNRYLSAWKDRRLVTIKQKHVEELHTEVGKTYGQVTANRLVTFLRTVFYHAIKKMNWKGDNPARDPGRNEILYEEQSRDRYLLPEEAVRLFKALRLEPNRALQDFVLLALLTGQRRSDVLSMRWSSLNLTQAIWTLTKPTKRRQSYSVALMPEAIELLEKRRKLKGMKGDWVFPARRGASGHLVNVNKPWKALLKRAKIEHFTIHDLRRTLGSWMATSGASLPMIGKALGHQSQASTAVYARLQLGEVREAMGTATTKLLTAGVEKT